jgi:hypothetical protein
MNKLFYVVAAALLSVTAASPTLAQAPTTRVPMCLQIRDGVKSYLPCTGVVAVDPATGNAIDWSSAFGASDTVTGQANAKAKSVQNGDGTKIASDVSVQQVKTALGTPYQAGGPLPLPTGAATDAQLITAVTRLTAVVAALQGTLTTNATVTASALPTGAATSAKQDALQAAMAATVVSISYTDKTIVSLSADQAAGIASIIVANPARKAFAITPTNDGRLYVSSNLNGFFYPLYAGVTRSFSGSDCPQNALYVTGQTAATPLPIVEG